MNRNATGWKRLFVSVVALAAVGGVCVAAEPGRGAAVVRSAGVTAGFCVHLGCGDGKGTAELAGTGKFLVQGLSSDPKMVAAARKRLRAAGVYGRASAARCSPDRLPYADNMVNLLVAENLDGLLAGGLGLKEIIRVVCPGGVAMLAAGPAGGEKALTARLTAAGIRDSEIVRPAGVWVKVRKPRPAGMDEWTHWRHGPAGNAASQDELIGPPARLKWIDGRAYGDSGGRQGAGFVSAGGRFFHTLNDVPSGIRGPMRPYLVARDAFNGLVLWKKPLPALYVKFPDQKYNRVAFKRRTLVATSERVFTVLAPDGPLAALDAATGKTLITYEAAGPPEEVLHYKGALILAGGGPVRSIDPKTGRSLWKGELTATRIVAGGGRVYLRSPQGLVALDASTGGQLWRTRAGRSDIAYYHKEVLAFRSGGTTTAISAKDGSLAWRYKYPNVWGGRRGYHFTPDFATGGLCWVHSIVRDKQTGGYFIGLDPATGEVRRRVRHVPLNNRCYPNFATPNYAIMGDSRILNLKTGWGSGTSLTRGHCSIGYLPANGLIYNLPQGCQCASSIRGIMATVGPPAGKFEPDELTAPGRFRKGPAYGKLAAAPPKGPGGWPTYRADPARSACADGDVAPDIGPTWSADLKTKITSPVVAGGKVYVAAVDAHQIVALDAASGRTIWRAEADGRVDAPPTIYKGLCLFGTRTGWVTCLRTDDGREVWSFRAAPTEHLIMAYGQVESSWPVHGGVLVQDGKVFFAAGRSSESVGGIFFYAADPFSGKIIWQGLHRSLPGSYQTDLASGKILWKKPRRILGTSFDSPSVDWARNEYWGNQFRINDILLGDLLVGDGESVYMRRWAFANKDGRSSIKRGPLTSTRGGVSLLTDTSYMKRIYHSWNYAREFAQMLVFDKQNVYGFRNRSKLGEGVKVFGKSIPVKRGKWLWSVEVPVRIASMVVAGKTLLIGGTPEAGDAKDPWAGMAGRKGGVLWALSTADGSTLAKHTLAAAPYFDGVAAAGGRVYVSTRNGKLLCLGKKPK